MDETYTLQQAMDRLGLKSANALYQRKQATEKLGLTSRYAFDKLKAKYPLAFVVVRQGTDRCNPTLYDKQMLDKFAKIDNFLKQEDGQL